MLSHFNINGQSARYLNNFDWTGKQIWEEDLSASFLEWYEDAFVKTASNGEILVGTSLVDYYTSSNWETRQSEGDYVLVKYQTTPVIISPHIILENTHWIDRENADYPTFISTELKNFTSPVTKVEFYANNVKIGEDIHPNYFSISFRRPAGIYHIYAKAYDNAGNIVVSPTRPLTILRSTPELYRAIDLNGSELKIDGITYESKTAPNFTYQAKAYANQTIALSPATDLNRSNMLRSVLYGSATSPGTFTFNNVPAGYYEVCFYIWEDNYSSTIGVSVEGQAALINHKTGSKGSWSKVGPFLRKVTDGNIEIKTTGGDANIAGIEVWKLRERENMVNVNLNGGTAYVDGLVFNSIEMMQEYHAFSFSGRRYENQSLPPFAPEGNLNEQDRVRMIKSCVYGTKASPAQFTFGNVEEGTYDVFTYVWEDNYASVFSLYLENQLVLDRYNSGSKGTWKRVGPFRTTVNDGNIVLRTAGGDANISGIEVWKVNPLVLENNTASVSRLQPEKTVKLIEGTTAYPNPVKDKVFIELPDNITGKVSIITVDAYVQVFQKSEESLNEESIELNLSNLKPGVYFLNVKTSSGVKSLRVIKE